MVSLIIYVAHVTPRRRANLLLDSISRARVRINAVKLHLLINMFVLPRHISYIFVLRLENTSNIIMYITL